MLVFATSDCDRCTKHRRVERDRKQRARDNQVQTFRGKQTQVYPQAGKDKRKFTDLSERSRDK